MKVKDVMSVNPACCSPDTGLRDVARLMLDHDCGQIPVVENRPTKPLSVIVGVITDRDITIRAVARDRNPLELTAGDCMTRPCIVVSPEASLEACCQLMEDNQIRRVLVMDEEGTCCGIVAQADIARSGSKDETRQVVVKVSRPPASYSEPAPLMPTPHP